MNLYTPMEFNMICHHEAGHAVVAYFLGKKVVEIDIMNKPGPVTRTLNQPNISNLRGACNDYRVAYAGVAVNSYYLKHYSLRNTNAMNLARTGSTLDKKKMEIIEQYIRVNFRKKCEVAKLHSKVDSLIKCKWDIIHKVANQLQNKNGYLNEQDFLIIMKCCKVSWVSQLMSKLRIKLGL